VVGGVGGGRNIQIGEGGDLIIGNLQASESDNYTCLVENNMGSDKITYVLLVQGKSKWIFGYIAICMYRFNKIDHGMRKGRK
jgi:hypothetical protein